MNEQESRLGKLARCLPPSQNTIIPHRVILKYPQAYQTNLEKISDYLLCGEDIWWRHIVAGVEFLDGPDENRSNDKGPPLHHFRSYTLKSEDQYLMECWKECVTHQVTIPHHVDEILEEPSHEEIPIAQDNLSRPQTESAAPKQPTTPSQLIAEVNAETPKLKTTLAKNVLKVLGETNEVKTLDKLLLTLRDNLKSKQAQDNYEAALATVQTQVLAKHSTVRQQFKEWEQCFFTEHNCNAPTADDIRADRKGHDLYQTLRLYKQLSQHWNITVHL
ncbi:hypothetical protein ACROYT_G015049 [Oculina patagonica]